MTRLAADSDEAEAPAGRKRELLRAKLKSLIRSLEQKIAANSNMAAGTSAGLGGQVSASSAAVLPQPAGSQLGPYFVCGKTGHFK